MKQLLSRWLISYLTKEIDRPAEVTGLGFKWLDVVQPGDVILVEGRTRISAAIKYLTQSTWSHAALVLNTEPGELLEADVKNGVTKVEMGKYLHANVRICRPIGLAPDDRETMLSFAESHLGISYDVKNLVDLARYLMPTPPVPVRFRRQMLTFGSGDPTEKLICSALIARSFQHIRYPVLPVQWWDDEGEIMSQVRHYSVFVPRDFDLSPYFEIVKPTTVQGFNYLGMNWHPETASLPEPGASQ